MGHGGNRWVRPEVYPIVAVMAFALGINVFSIARNAIGHPDVRISKEDRGAGYLENFKEGKNYKLHGLRKYLTDKDHEVMPGINSALGGFKKEK
ncbi:hypothetical protein MPTK1_3g24440 [Marchantia polymorpha subsp. ruderalis]|uniref:Uncharacterized protein n=2 Tax=Marchantia polymorpha TaxID=3197 RepID=A0AAF6B4C5_MARPO|nr:hypothetical protein MARPO_0178s0010 [Marchantia polymorpha]BBN06859.1 hypothetical protein Mp_3g24440 [Marchantia polymorpha subsp. ruderalis]|eukprot:PTQ27957.1 hypothetical protein MARPO_0178s0010 [Marchantia polymorpha]